MNTKELAEKTYKDLQARKLKRKLLKQEHAAYSNDSFVKKLKRNKSWYGNKIH